MTSGLDTGFFLRLLEGRAEAVRLWLELLEGDQAAVVSCLSLFELDRLGLKGKIERRAAETAQDAIVAVCEVVWINSLENLREAARIAHGAGIPAVDALILAGLLAAGAERILTTDSDLMRYRRKGLKILPI